ncbi:threonine synthase [Thalassoglobus sp. JC818]|uniref:threonine synthase n=1 Tax=Thalassoglobus sp. JC818 TaxID=3232136 RepID=UPI00345A74F2
MHQDLKCSLTGESYAIDQLQNLSAAGKPLLAEYDLDAIKETMTPKTVRARNIRSMWKFWEVMPVDSPEEAVSLGEGCTPLLKANRVGPFEPFENLFVKDESFNPTGSFKARGMSAAVTRAKALGVKAIALPSAGNAAGAATYYAAQAGLECHLFVPEDTPPANIVESKLGGANIYLVNGLISDCGRLCREACNQFGWFDLSTLKEPFRVEGKKTMGYELAFDLADHFGTDDLQLPDVIFYPTGGGTGLIGMWKAFDEMEALGWIGSSRPKMVAVQAEGCSPIVKAYLDGEDSAPLFPNAATCASGLRVPIAVGDFLMLDAIRKSSGTAISVSDQKLMQGTEEICRWQGISACPEGGAVWKAAEQLMSDGWLSPEETIVLFNTGTGLKYNHLFQSDDIPRIDHEDENWMKILEQES